MFVYTTCATCGELLHTTADDHGSYNTTHPGCPPPTLTKIKRLEQDWLAAVLAEDTSREAELQALIDEFDRRPPRLLDAAICYARWGWPVFPLRQAGARCDGGVRCRDTCVCPKKPATRHGFKDATTDLNRIEKWWKAHPRSNIGLATGHRFDVIDIDAPIGVHSYLALLEEEDPRTGGGPLPDCHGQVVTASGGLHLYVTPTGAGNREGIRPGIDYRGVGGYVVAPPSTLGTPGRSWSWLAKPSPKITEPQNG